MKSPIQNQDSGSPEQSGLDSPLERLPEKDKDKRILLRQLGGKVLLHNNRIGIAKASLRSKPDRWLVEEFRFALGMYIHNNYDVSTFDNVKDMRAIEKALLWNIETLDYESVPDELRWTSSSPWDLSLPENHPHFARRPDLKGQVSVPQQTVEAMTIQSSQALVVNEEAMDKFILPWLDTLDMETADKLFPDWPTHGFETELTAIGSDPYFVKTARCDLATRVYPHGSWHHHHKMVRLYNRWAKKVKLSKKDLADMAELFTSLHGDTFLNRVDDIIKDPLGLAKKHGWSEWEDTLEYSHALAWREARDTGYTSWIYEVDAISSGMQHMFCVLGLMHMLQTHSNEAYADFVAPKDRFTEAIRNRIRHARNASYADARALVSSVMNALMYGGGHKACVSGMLDITYDKDGNWRIGSEKDGWKDLDVPAVFAAVCADKSNPDIVKVLTKYGRKLKVAFDREFGFFKELLESASEAWEAGWDRDGIPGCIESPLEDYTLQPGVWKMDRHATSMVELNDDVSVQVGKALLNKAGSAALAAWMQHLDACTASLWTILMDGHDRNILTIHDAGLSDWTSRFLLVGTYQQAIETTNGVTLIDPNSVLVRH